MYRSDLVRNAHSWIGGHTHSSNIQGVRVRHCMLPVDFNNNPHIVPYVPQFLSTSISPTLKHETGVLYHHNLTCWLADACLYRCAGMLKG